MDHYLTKELVAAGLTVGAGLGAWLKWFLPWWISTRTRKTMVSGLRALHSIYSKMERVSAHGAERIIIFGGHDSGGVPRAGSPFYATALHWHVSKEYPDVIGDYSEIPVDGSYIGMLLTLERKGYFHFDMEQVSDCLLKRFYLAEGVRDSVIYYLACMDNTFLYLTCASFTRRFTANEIISMQIIAQAIGNDIKAAK